MLETNILQSECLLLGTGCFELISYSAAYILYYFLQFHPQKKAARTAELELFSLQVAIQRNLQFEWKFIIATPGQEAWGGEVLRSTRYIVPLTYWGITNTTTTSQLCANILASRSKGFFFLIRRVQYQYDRFLATRNFVSFAWAICFVFLETKVPVHIVFCQE